MHELSPLPGAIVPAAHAWQGSCPVVLKNPGAHEGTTTGTQLL
jgi:hypothetical protein